MGVFCCRFQTLGSCAIVSPKHGIGVYAMAAPKCGAKTKAGKSTCGRPAGWGTDHFGTGSCKFHGGSTPNGMISAAKQQAAVMGVPLDIAPHEALLQCIRITAGEVAYCNLCIQQLQPDEVAGPVTTSRPLSLEKGAEDPDFYVEEYGPPGLNIWVRARQQALERLAKFAKMALDAGVNERRVQIAEGMAQLMAPVLKAIFDELQLSPAQRKKAPAIMKSHLLELEGETALLPEPVGNHR